jgi:hypothetical protein
MYHSGERVDVGQFSREMVGSMIEEYAENAEAMSERRWSKILGICGIHNTPVDRPIPSAPSMQQKRRHLYIPSSPNSEE